MKSAPRKIPARLRANTDFSYVEQLPHATRRTAAIYEYWRHSDEHKEVIAAFRKAGVFKEEWDGKGLDPKLRQKCLRQPQIFDLEFIDLFCQDDAFPEKPFRDSGLKDLRQSWRTGIDVLDPFDSESWNALKGFRKVLARRGQSEMDVYGNQPPGTTVWVISINWRSYRDAELTDQFGKMIRGGLRPPEFPEPKKAGRGGRSAGSRALDMLRQLAAFRLLNAGFDFDSTSKLTHYRSPKGWKNAVLKAEKRLGNMTKQPIFD
jgi:hypothetical protein